MTTLQHDFTPDEQLKVKKLVPEAVLPLKANDDDAGYDLTAISDPEVKDSYVQYRTGISIEVPKGYHTELFPRSSISKYDLVLANSVGLVDNGYRGEVLLRFKITPRVAPDGEYVKFLDPKIWPPRLYIKGDKVAQIVIRKTITLPVVEVAELSDTARGDGGFGSSGR
jgi:dUTP pyrophosphatase